MKGNIKFISRESKIYIHGDKKDKWYYWINYLKYLFYSYSTIYLVYFVMIGMIALYYDTNTKELTLIEPYLVFASGVVYSIFQLLIELDKRDVELINCILFPCIILISTFLAVYCVKKLNFNTQCNVFCVVLVLTAITKIVRQILKELIDEEIETAINDNSIVEISFANCDTPAIEKEESEE